MKLISARRIRDENLWFVQSRKIVDAHGIEYDAILNEDDTVFDGQTEYKNVKTFEKMFGAELVAHTRGSFEEAWLYWSEDTGEFIDIWRVLSCNEAHGYVLERPEAWFGHITTKDELELYVDTASKLPPGLTARIRRMAVEEVREPPDPYEWLFAGGGPLVHDPGDDLPVLVVPHQKSGFGQD
jgi:hypothetical protein